MTYLWKMKESEMSADRDDTATANYEQGYGFHWSLLRVFEIALIFSALHFSSVETANSCTENQFLVEHKDGSTSCEDCETCPPGQGLWPKCGTRVPANTMVTCVPCQPGVSFSSNYGTSSCTPCAPPCLEDQVVLKKCTPTDNVRCAKQCYSKDSYYDSIGERCQACSQCCGQERDVTVDECKQKLGASSDMICSLSSAKWCVTTTATTLVTTSETSGLLNIFTRGSHLRSKRKDSVGAPILAAGIFGLVLVITCGLTSLLCSREPCSFPSGDVENGHHLEQKPLSTDEMLGSAGGGERNEAECETDNSVVVRSGSRELLLNKQVQHSEAFTCTCQMDSKKDSKLLSSLLDDENALEMICTCLDTPIPLLGDYRAVAQHYGFNHYQITSRLEKEAGGPSKALIESIVATDPDLTVQEFAAVVGETTKRNDVVKLLRTFDFVGDKEICTDLSQE